MVNIIALVENTTSSPALQCKHGLCLYIETGKHKILFDLGPDDTFAKNAQKLGIDLSQIDTVIISHGHKDHGGGLKAFMELNSNAKIYIRKAAFDPHYIKLQKIPFPVSLDKRLSGSERFVFTDDSQVIDDELAVFSNVKSRAFHSSSNDVLFAKTAHGLTRDCFDHEQNLILTSGSQRILISGCSHSGIVNIQNEAERMAGSKMSYVIGGFHLFNPPTNQSESKELIDRIAGALSQNQTVYYTCHCTGLKVYEQMKTTLNDNLHYLSTGAQLSV